jgi:hypothetical protein
VASRGLRGHGGRTATTPTTAADNRMPTHRLHVSDCIRPGQDYDKSCEERTISDMDTVLIVLGLFVLLLILGFAAVGILEMGWPRSKAAALATLVLVGSAGIQLSRSSIQSNVASPPIVA